MLVSAPAHQPRCNICDHPLVSGPLGQQCLRCTFALAAEEADEMSEVAALFPELRIEGPIARGGFATIFRAEHRSMQRLVALKFLDRQLSRSREAVAMFEQEMVHAGALDHPGIVRAYDAGEREGHRFILMEFIEGEDCGSLVRRHGRLPVAESCELIRQAALALHYAHLQGRVHRDVKPGNLMLTSASPASVKVLDFGLANLVVAPLFSEADEYFLGTLEYVAPEQIEEPHRVDARADIYALGATLRRMLTGRALRECGSSEHSLFQQMRVITSKPAPPISRLRPDLPRALRALCDRLVTLDPASRPASAQELADLLEPWCSGAELARVFGPPTLPERPFPVPARRPRRVKLASGWQVALIVILVAMALVAWQVRSPRRYGRVLPGAVAAPPALGGWTSLFSPEFMKMRELLPDIAPRLYSREWQRETEISSSDFVLSPHFLPDGRLSYLHRHPDGTTLLAVTIGQDDVRPLLPRWKSEEPEFFAISPTGFLAWSRPQDRQGQHIGRASPEGELLSSLSYDASRERLFFLQGVQQRLTGSHDGSEAYPWGLAAVFPGQVPENTGLAPGDLLIADEGHKPILPSVERPPGLWRARFDDGAPATRLGTLEGSRHWPIDVAVGRSGVFLLNRSETIPSGPISSEDLERRILRWDQEGFHACVTDQPIYDPSGIAADPLSSDLYVTQGSLIPSSSLAVQRLLRLRPVAGRAGHYAVELVAERFGRMASAGVAFSPDGRHLAVCDYGNRVIVVLQRVQPMHEPPK